MTPAPSTPTPRRFLLKKPPPSQKQETPAAPRGRGTPQFRATPRFAPPSSNVRPAPHSVSSSALRPPPRHVDPINDVLDSSQLEGDEEEDRSPSLPPAFGPSDDVPESIVLDSEAGKEYPEPSDRESAGARLSKRRRISISPELAWTTERDTGIDTGLEPLHEEQSPDRSSSEESELSRDEAAETGGSDDEPSDLPARQAKQQPTFRKAPRFKTSETEDPARQEGLPGAFSPQRRGVRFLPGGLAAEMQGWLSAVKGWEGDERQGEEQLVRILVDEARVGDNAYLVRGRRLLRDDGTGDDYVTSSPVLRLVLAGEGRLTGLGRRAEVRAGDVVSVSQPAWQVELDVQGQWTVACDWAISANRTM